jgi:hypothetical protein
VPKRRQSKPSQARYRVAEEAARLMREHGIKDYLLAKRKAAERLGIRDRTSLPGNEEIAAALTEQQRLFGGDAYRTRLRELREAARRAMRMMEGFEPRLVGSVLSGAVTQHSDVDIHVFADAPEDIAVLLIERHIPYEVSERRIRYSGDRAEAMPAYSFMAGDVAIEATVFPPGGLRQAPSCPIDGRPLKRARMPELAALLKD